MRNCFNRMKNRMKAEGICLTIKYIFCVFLNCLCEKFYDTALDLHYSRRLLKGNLTTAYKGLGANDVYHTKYCAMPIIFHFVQISGKDVLVDVGCGKGRVINYWLSKRLKNRIIGLELDPQVAGQTAKQFAGRRNVKIIAGDAISNLPADGTIFYFYNPFCEEKVKEFEKRMAVLFKNRPVTIVYYNPKSISAFRNRNWRIKYINFEKDLGIRRWGRINKFHDLALIRNKIRR